ncbi:hypothetical protein BN7_2908 [Wickerhamomyces ciferrii]|uniref:Uncharacterized protein n=1 Tax=Wickerhamomyces ciferrii (strain ATCC 14091 / BCRC 22168 / CBS 111 / JCM 3599 / NBRC 0793 / NRRL Y-1031 F-60-10) TaxID=1206466 RepID=K0KE36_WICCF|nr:uncharacterized protein BN7_2908 [Wickerhamomyces ciferrii]CCH43360.1 hypothetical protein BN7_2908 [Wickerhamomyces ciferrii]
MADLDTTNIAQFKPAFLLHFEVTEEPVFINSNESTTLIHAKIAKGYSKSLDEKYSFETEALFGWDNVRIRAGRDSNIQDLDAQVFLKSKKNGGIIHLEYTGVSVNNEKSEAILKGGSESNSFTDAYITNHPKFTLDSKNTDEQWVQGRNFLGKGRHLRTEDGNFGIEYVVYVLE